MREANRRRAAQRLLQHGKGAGASSSGQASSACGKLDAFINEVRAQAGNKIPAGAAADLIAVEGTVER